MSQPGRSSEHPPPSVRLSLSNRSENVLLVRQMLTGVAEAIELDAAELNDISTAVTEACNNVVLHAYRGEEGPLEIELRARTGALEVVVRDHGTGMLPPVDGPDQVTGIGLPVIRALARSSAFTSTPAGEGTEVRMTFATPRVSAPEPTPADEFARPAIVVAEPADSIEITIAPKRLARTILPRVLSVSAARAHFTTDRIADLQRFSDSLVAHAPGFIRGEHLSLAIHVQPHEIELRIAPMKAGRAEEMLAAGALESLTRSINGGTEHGRIAVTGAAPDAEVLELRLIDPA
jgi:serine/threonine-protein kinase RsbW